TAKRDSVADNTARRVCFLSIALMLLIPFLEGVKYALPLGLATTYGIVFSLFAFSLMYWPNSPLVGSTIGWIGKISYSGYFIHFLVLHYLPSSHLTNSPTADFVIIWTAVAAVTVAASTITYLTIEKPMIRLGSALIAARQLSTEGIQQARA